MPTPRDCRQSLSPGLPTPRVALGVVDGDHHDSLLFEPIVYRVRESLHPDVPDVLVDRSIQFRVVLDAIQDILDFG